MHVRLADDRRLGQGLREGINLSTSGWTIVICAHRCPTPRDWKILAVLDMA
jgi:hypothetical protein